MLPLFESFRNDNFITVNGSFPTVKAFNGFLIANHLLLKFFCSFKGADVFTLST